MTKISVPSHGTLLAHLRGLHVRYGELEDQYCTLHPSVRRNVLGPFPEERFYCAAILQWRPSSHAFKTEKLFGTTNLVKVTTAKKGSGEKHNEICPIWVSFFDDINGVNGLLKEAAGDVELVQASTLLQEAEKKADWVEVILKKIVGRSSPIRSPATAASYTYGGWNELCLEVTSGYFHQSSTYTVHERKTPPSLATAVGRLQKGSAGQSMCDCDYDLRNEISNGTRRWFVYTPQPFLPHLEVDCPPVCMGWLLTPYNEYGQWDPDKQYLYDQDTEAVDLLGAKRRDIKRPVDMPNMSREDWLAWIESHRWFLTEASESKARRMRIALHRGRDRPRTSTPATNLDKPLPPLPGEDMGSAAAEGMPTHVDEDGKAKGSKAEDSNIEDSKAEAAGPPPPPYATSEVDEGLDEGTTASDRPSTTTPEPTRGVPRWNPEPSRNWKPTKHFAPTRGPPGFGIPPPPETPASSASTPDVSISTGFESLGSEQNFQLGSPGENDLNASSSDIDSEDVASASLNERERRPYVQTKPAPSKAIPQQTAGHTSSFRQAGRSSSRSRRPYTRMATSERFTPYPQGAARGQARANKRSASRRSSSRVRRPYCSTPSQEKFSMRPETDPSRTTPAGDETKQAPPRGPAPEGTPMPTSKDMPSTDRSSQLPPERPKRPVPAPAATPRALPTEPRALWAEYNARWEALGPEDPSVLVPSPTLDVAGLIKAAEETEASTHPEVDFSKHSVEGLAAIQIQGFFTAGMDVSCELYEDANQRKLKARLTDKSEAKVTAMLKHLKRKELVRWHPDRLNRRTGSAGILNEGNGRQELVVLIRTAVEELIEACREHLEKLR
ncbi:hypothetical protein LTR85_009054 [Meristemomyces frigidus]|nr:hypothetical protein LTR85_009054 [Meristemomyces frigidus]